MNSRKENVVVVGSGLNALGVLRSLKKRFNVLLITEKNSYVDKSKYGGRLYVKSTTAPDIVNTLVEIANTFIVKPVLFLTEEKAVYHVSANQEELAGYRFDMPSHQLMEALQSKEGFQAAAEQVGSPVPKSILVKAQSDLEKLSTLAFPCVFKPMVQCKQYGKRFKKAYKVEGVEEIAELYQEIAPIMSDMIAQEWIEGEDSDIYFCLAYFDKNCQLVSSFSGRKLRSWPLNIGGTAACTAAPDEHKELLTLTSSFVEKIGYVGLIGMEFKFDTIRNSYYMIEPTVGRTDYQHEIATLSNVDFIGRFVGNLLGEEVSSKEEHAEKGIVWFDEFADANALANGARVFSDLELKKVGALKRWSDIGPYFSYVKTALMRRIGLSSD